MHVPRFFQAIPEYGHCSNSNNLKIAENAFSGCGLTSITIGNQVKKIGQSAFARNNKLTEVNIPENIRAIPECIVIDFLYCQKIYFFQTGGAKCMLMNGL